MHLTQALIRRRRTHTVHVLANDALGSVADVREQLSAAGPFTFESFHLAHGAPGSPDVDQVNDHILNWRYACSSADVVHVSSVFEGGNAHVSARMADVPASVRSATLYDLIPLVFDDVYLSVVRRQYLARLGALHQVDVVFAISEATRRDAIARLDLPPERVVNIGAATSGVFFPLGNRLARPPERLAKAGFPGRYLLYVGGVDFRKNTDFLLRAYAALPASTRDEVRLVIVCELSPEKLADFLARAQALGIGRHVLFTGYVPDDELNDLYNGCELFVFPSLYEGFGLPLLEAMTCGAPVIASNTSSMPDIIGRADALFDPHDEGALTAMLDGLIRDAPRRSVLAEASLERSRDFSWDRVADTMLLALEAVAERGPRATRSPSQPRRRAALFTPLPPARTSVADYARTMMPYWSRYFDLELVVEQGPIDDDNVVGAYPMMDARRFEREAGRFDTLLYHFGDSSFHAPMYRLLPRHPGIVVMHDFFLSGVLQSLEVGQPPAHGAFIREILATHPEAAEEFALGATRADLALKYPVSRRVIEHARGLIFHSRYALGLLQRFYPDLAAVPACVVPQACVLNIREGRREAKRRELGLQAGDVLVGVFGFLVQTQEDVLLEALAQSLVAQNARIHLALIGEAGAGNLAGPVGQALQSHPLRERIAFTGAVSDDEHGGYLAACDVGISLRSYSRGETLAALLTQLAAGCATIVTDHAAMSELPDAVAVRVPPKDAGALAAAIAALAGDPDLRARLGHSARTWVERERHPAKVAEAYRDAIAMLEAQDRARSARTLVDEIGAIASRGRVQADIMASAAQAVAAGISANPASARWLQGQPTPRARCP